MDLFDRLEGHRRPKNNGFTVIELMVGITLLAILMVGFVPVFAQGLAQSSAARFKSVATNIAREKIEQIRQLDYREVVEDTTDPDDPTNLSVRFGTSVTIPERDMTFSVEYEVESEVLPDQAIKSVQVTVTWAAPPVPVSPAVVKTMVAQQYLGPRAAWLELTNTSADNVSPGGTPFPLLATNGVLTTVKYHIAQSDWFMAYDTLSLPLPSPNDISLESFFSDEAGGKVDTIKVDNTGLKYSTDGSPAAVDDIWFEYSFDARVIPDGYWDLRVAMLNAFDEPGNIWTLRVRVEKDHPGPPTAFTAKVTSSTTVALSWMPADERDRARYVLERREWTLSGGWSAWQKVSVPAYPDLPANTLPPIATAFTDTGTLHPSNPALDVPPCGRPWPGLRCFQYRVYGVDTGDRYDTASAPTATVWMPNAPTPKVVVPAVTTLLLDAAKTALTALGLGWSVTETISATATPGTVLTQSPSAGTEVEDGAIVALTVAIAAPSPPVQYQVVITKTKNPAQTIVVLDGTGATKYFGSISKQSSVVLSLLNGHYTIHLNSASGTQLGDFYVSGAACSPNIP
jgi:prepilin-type N-terminal cleavage/methylation domain-containing protein